MKHYRVVRIEEPVPLEGSIKGTPWEAAYPAELDELPWGTAESGQSTVVRLLYDEHTLYLQYHVEGDRIYAKTSELNGPVWEDSCVELFATLEPTRRPHYINFEINCIGVFRLGFGPDRHNRKLITPDLADSIRVRTSVASSTAAESSDDGRWWVAVALPFEAIAAFTGLSVSPSKETVWRGNFHRIGGGDDSLFAVWNPVNAPNPDFHRPSQFGKLVFE